MLKVLLVFILIYVLTIFVFSLIIKHKNKKMFNLENEMDSIATNMEQVEIKYNVLVEELKIEKENNEKLIEKISAISSIPINDVISQLQNNKNNYKG